MTGNNLRTKETAMGKDEVFEIFEFKDEVFEIFELVESARINGVQGRRGEAY